MRTLLCWSVVVALCAAVAVADGCRAAEPPVVVATTEIYDPVANTCESAAPMLHPRQGHAAIALRDGRLLVCGGRSPGGGYDDNRATAEIYDPQTGKWSQVASMFDARHGHTATLLADGSVLVVSGEYPQTGSCEIYEPKSGKWRRVASLTTPRDRHAAVQLPDGRVHVSGGFCHPRGGKPVPDAEAYDPADDAWTHVAPMTGPRAYHTAVVLNDGQVFVAGGENGDHPPPRDNLATAELYDPRLEQWHPAGNMSIARAYGQSGSLLPDGSVLLVGGEANTRHSQGMPAQATTEAYDPAKQAWQPAGSLHTPRHFHTATTLANGDLLVTGGYNFERPVDTAERYDPASGKWRDVARMQSPRAWHSATLLADGRVLIAGGLTAP